MNIMRDEQPVFYQPGKPGMIDLAIERNGVLTGGYSGETLEQIRLRYPAAEVGTLGAVCAASEDMFRSKPVRITEERFCEMLDVLPPEGWIRRDGCESFKLCERTSGNITAIFARIGADYFEMQDSIFTKHDAIIAACRAADCGQFVPLVNGGDFVGKYCCTCGEKEDAHK